MFHYSILPGMYRYDIANVQISNMTRGNSHEAFSLACKVFVNSSVLHAEMNVTLDEYREYMLSAFNGMQAQGLSLVAIDVVREELVGCLMACDYAAQPHNNINTPETLIPVKALLQNLDKHYKRFRKIRKQQCMLVDMAVVKPEACGIGVYTKLREHAHRLGRKAGFKYVVGELSSAATQHLCIDRFGHSVRAEIDYATFSVKGRKPFSAIKVPSSIVLVEGAL